MTEVVGVPMAVKAWKDLDDSENVTAKYCRPPGYQARARLLFANLQVPTLLDSCASCRVMPEEIAK